MDDDNEAFQLRQLDRRENNKELNNERLISKRRFMKVKALG